MISIIMPFQNEAKYLEQSIASILQQSEQDFELLAVDDHSQDESYQILQNFAAQDSRIHLFKSEQGHGTIPALKIAMQNAKGEFVTRFDADDLMPITKLAELKEILLQNGPGHVATGRVEYFSEGPLGEGFQKYAAWLNGLCDRDDHYQHLFRECVIASPNWMLYRSDLEKLDGIDGAIYPEDYYLVFQLYMNKFKIIASPQVTHQWRDHPVRASRTKEEYRDQKFFKIKVDYFERIYGREKVILWGAGPTGKKLAKELLAHNFSFRWLTNNTNKIGKRIFDQEIEHFEVLKEHLDHRLLISVSQRGSQPEILSYLEEIQFTDFFEF